MNEDQINLVKWFRESSPYINSHRQTTAVVVISSDALTHPNRKSFLHDLATLHNLGMGIVVVFGSRAYIDRAMTNSKHHCSYHNGRRITDKPTMKIAQEVSGYLLTEIESQMSMGLVNSSMHQSDINVISGNFVIAKPMGIVDGIDHQHTGTVRRINAQAIRAQLEHKNLVIVAPIGYSPSGESFNLESESLAASIAQSLNAEKLIIALDTLPVTLPTQIVSRQVNEISNEYQQHGDLVRSLHSAATSVTAGVLRSHLIDINIDGCLLTEMYTRDGIGTMVIKESYLNTRPAGIDDLPSIISLIRPLEESGMLVRRSRKRIEMELPYFSVIEKDGLIISCCALYPYDGSDAVELACVATHPGYQGVGAAKTLLAYAEDQARLNKKSALFILTTGSAHWFVEQGFNDCALDLLPPKKQRMYNFQRNSKAMIKYLS